MLKKYLEPPAKLVLKNIAKIKINKLLNHSFPQFGEIIKSVNDTIEKNILPADKELLRRIEQRRTELLNSDETIKMIDYGAGLKREGLSEEEMRRGQTVEKRLGDIAFTCSKSPFWAFLIFNVIRNIKPLNCLEFGTCVGISGAYQGVALKQNGKGRLFTMEGDHSLAEIAKSTFSGIGLNNVEIMEGRFADTLEALLSGQINFDYVFIDGHHDKNATIKYFNIIYPKLTPNAILIFDDISWSKGMRSAWKIISADARVRISLDLRQLGICLIDKNITNKLQYRIPLIG